MTCRSGRWTHQGETKKDSTPKNTKHDTHTQIHFHEVGAVDSIVDTVGTVLALHLLGVERVYASALPFGEVGGGWECPYMTKVM